MDDHSVAGEALFASLMMSTLMVRLVDNGILTQGEAIRMVDTAMLVLETHRSDGLPGTPAVEANDRARDRLESLLRALQDTRPPGS